MFSYHHHKIIHIILQSEDFWSFSNTLGYIRADFIFLYLYLCIIPFYLYVVCYGFKSFCKIWFSVKSCEVVRATLITLFYIRGKGWKPVPLPQEDISLPSVGSVVLFNWMLSVTHHWWNDREGKDTS